MAPIDPSTERTVVDAAAGGEALLPVGFALQEFVIEGLLGVGGFGIVYRARDTRLQREVALKEYMPATLAARRRDLSVSARSSWQIETFEVGLRSFVNEAQLLASFDHPSLVKVLRFWEGNGTAYMAMPLYRGVTLKSWLRDSGVGPDEAWLMKLLLPLADALEQMHGAQPCCLHRDVAPDNILLIEPSPAERATALETPRPLLLDFGSARRVIADATHTLTAFLKPGYAPIEQYGEADSMKQGPWTDVYALSAVLYACITGRAPDASADRILADELVSAASAGAGRYSPRFLAAIDAGLTVRPEGRPQSMRELRRLFVDSPATVAGADGIGGAPAPRGNRPRRSDALVHGGRPTASGWAVAAALVVVATVIAWAWWPDSARPPMAPPTASAQRPVTAGVPAATDAPAAVEGTGVAAAPPPGVATAVEPFSVLTALQDLVNHADPTIVVSAAVDKSTLVIGKDALRFRVRSSQPGYLYVFFGGTDTRHFHLLFPNRLDKSNRIEPGVEMVLPRPGWEITAGGPPGTNHLVVLVSHHERNLANAGLRETREPIPEFDLAQAERLWQRRAPGANPFVGEPQCATAVCSPAFGAAMLKVDEVAAKGRPRQ